MKKLKELVVSIFVISLTIITLGSKSLATESTSGMYLQLKNQSNGRDTGFYVVGTDGSKKPVIKIVETNQAGTTEDASKAIYCIKDGVGFGSEASSGDIVKYTQYFDLKAPNSINDTYKSALPQDTTTYNELVWLLDNICIPTDSASKNKLLTSAGLATDEFSSIMSQEEEKDVIEVIQQAAIWYYTNPSGEYHPTNPTTFTVATTNGGIGTNLDDKYSLSLVEDENPVSVLYNYLINGAKNAVNSGFTYASSIKQSPTTFDKSNATVSVDGSNYLIGPYTISNTSSESTLNVKILNGTTELTNITILGENKTTALSGATTTDKIKTNLGNKFYIQLPITTSASNISIEVKTDYSVTTQTYWSTAANLVNSNQPVAIVEKQSKSETVSDSKNIIKPEFDLALRKFIISVNGVNPTTSRIPTYTQDDLKALATKNASLDSGTTLSKKHTKDALSVSTGDKVIYTIRVYNEGQIDGKATKITDYLPEGLELVPTSESTINAKYGWIANESNNKIITSDYLKDTVINKFDTAPSSGTYSIDYKDVQVECKVVATTKTSDAFLKNVAEITESTNDSNLPDRDSVSKNLSDEQKNSYAPGTSTQGKGYEDDDDYENLILPGKYFDVSLRKFIVQVNEKELKTGNEYDRAPIVDVSPLLNGKTTASYKHTKNPVSVSAGDTVIYTFRVYNEGQIDGYVDEVVDHLPEELEFINDDFNAGYGWTIDSTDKTQRTIKTSYLSKENDVDNILKSFNTATTNLSYKDIKIKCKVKETAPTLKQITNIAEITKSSNSANLVDRDNANIATIPSDKDLPNYKGKDTNKSELADKDYYYEGQEDDDDFEKIILEKFDLALRKFITGVNQTTITNRVPQVDTSKYGTIVDGKEITTFEYNHTKEPVRVCQNDKVTYTIRIYNEGTQSGYASEVKDDVPDGLVFLPGDSTNVEYRWVMYDKDGNVTTDSSRAVSIRTDYLSKEQEKTVGANLLKAYDAITMQTPDYRDLKVTFKVSEPNTSDRILINKAEISKDANSEGKDVNDIDSTPDKWVQGEDDQDIEKIYVKYFDLALRKWVSQAIVIEDGVQKEMDTGHNAEQDPEPIVKVEVNKKRIENTIIKFRYQIRVTNEGEIEGYATEVSDYIPEGLQFNQADNEKWKEVNGKIVTDQLKDTLLKPGESATVDVVLTWINGEDNMGVKVNVAEISKDQNDSNTPDIDSTPNNKKEGEDDIDDAPVALTVVTGSSPKYIAIIGGTVLIIAVGIFLIKKYVL